MKTIIAGSRTINSFNIVDHAIKKSRFQITEVVCGGAKGVDYQGKQWALINDIPVIMFYADWNTLGKRAGYIRNAEMANYAEGLIAIWDGESKGTHHMINLAKRYKLKIFILHIKNIN